MVRAFFDWLQMTPMSQTIQASVWMYAIDQAFHLVFLAIFAGALLIVDLRLLGRGFTQQSVREVARDARPWLILGFIGLAVTGSVQVISGAQKEYFSGIFWIKMYILVAAIIYTAVVRRTVILADENRVGPFWSKVVGLLSIALWVGVAIPARLIGLF